MSRTLPERVAFAHEMARLLDSTQGVELQAFLRLRLARLGAAHDPGYEGGLPEHYRKQGERRAVEGLAGSLGDFAGTKGSFTGAALALGEKFAVAGAEVQGEAGEAPPPPPVEGGLDGPGGGG